MPNWVTVNIKADAEVLNSFLSESGDFDFEKIMPFKGHYFDLISTRVEDEAKKIVDFPLSEHPLLRSLEMNSRESSKFNALDLEEFEVLVKMLRNYKMYGFLHQMDFAITKWGTKWNACRTSVDLEAEFGTFETAWSCPTPLLIELSTLFPDKVIEIEYADEDIGSNCGSFTLVAGKFISENIAPSYQNMTDRDKKMWKDFAYRVTKITPEDYE